MFLLRTHDSATQTRCQGHTSRSWDLLFNFVSAPYLLNPRREADWGFIGMAFVCPSLTHSCPLRGPLHIPWTLWMIFIKLLTNDPLTGPITQLPRLKVKLTVQGHGIYPFNFVSAPYFLNPLNYFPQTSPKCSSQWDCVQNPCLIQLHRLKVTVQGHWDLLFNFGSAHISWTLWKIFIKIWSNIYLIDMMCSNHDIAMQTQGQGPLHISWTLWTIFNKLWLNVHLMETMCRIHDSATQTQDLGNSWRSLD